jgi:hypothetical protein
VVLSRKSPPSALSEIRPDTICNPYLVGDEGSIGPSMNNRALRERWTLTTQGLGRVIAAEARGWL